jgi:predicted GIY-YIG superfamily endonuclease
VNSLRSTSPVTIHSRHFDDTLPEVAGCYLIHFNERYRHAGHYLGYADDIRARVRKHRQGNGSRLMQVIANAGISWEVVRIWEGATRTNERQMKGHSSTRLCPVCNGLKAYNYKKELDK